MENSSCSSLIFMDSDKDRIEFSLVSSTNSSETRLRLDVNGETISEDMKRVELRQCDLTVVDEDGEESKVTSLREWIRVYSWFERVKAYLSPSTEIRLGIITRTRKRLATSLPSSNNNNKNGMTKRRCTTPRAKKINAISPKIKIPPSYSCSSAVSDAKRALSLSHVSCQKALPIRGEQVKQLETFIWSHLSKGKGGAMYVCGSPGTGKTMGVARAIHRIRERVRTNSPICLDVVHENAMTWHGEKDVSKALCKGLGLCDGIHGGWSMGRVRNRVLSLNSSTTSSNKKKRRMALVVIDEIDALVRTQTTGGPLHRLFEWASMPNSSLVLIGIANGVNLISKFFPRLRALRCEPELLVFEPYVTSRLLNLIYHTHTHTHINTDTTRHNLNKF